MLFPFGSSKKTCDGITRRQALRIGSTGLIGGLTLPRLLELQAKAATVTSAQATSCIFLFLEGGPSHIDMWDLKPDAPVEIRGPYRPIRTSVPGTSTQIRRPAARGAASDRGPLCGGPAAAPRGSTTSQVAG